MVINTLYQLYAAQRDTPKILAAADKMIMMPDLFHYWMTGNAVCEYTDASTTQFMNPMTRRWATDLLDLLACLPGFRRKLWNPEPWSATCCLVCRAMHR